MTAIVEEACRTIQDLDLNHSPLLWPYVDAYRPILREGAKLGISEPEVLEILKYKEEHEIPVWVGDTTEVIPTPHRDADKWPGITVGPSISYVGNKVVVEPEKGGHGTEPWKESMKRHPDSSPLARFRTNLPNQVSEPTQPFLNSVQNALCEISSLQIPSATYGQSIKPIKLRVSTGGACLALLGSIGAKTQYPWLGYCLLDKDVAQSFALPQDKCLQVGLEKVTRHMAMDETQKLILVGDETRMKSFAWGDSRRVFKKALPSHTLDSKRFEGPILTLANGTILRAGRAAAAVWRLDDIATHGPKGKSLIGRRLIIDEYDEELDMCPDIEESGGTPRASHIFFSDEPTFEPELWERLPNSSTLICVESRYLSRGDRNCLAIDFEHNGKTIAFLKGHRKAVSDVSISTADPRAFLTACEDGCARLFDLRQSYPVMEFKAGHEHDCPSVALAHPDNIPVVFTGTRRREQIKVWDIRARACMYELATGNNRVDSLSWDAKHNSLFASTSCSYKGESGSYNYRQAVVPQRTDASHPNNVQRGRNTRCWPRKSWHSEDYFEYAFDAGEDQVYRYVFKQEPDRYVLPEYGNAKEDSYTFSRYDDYDDDEDSDMRSDDDDFDEDEMDVY